MNFLSKNYIDNFMAEHNYSQESIDCVDKLFDRISSNSENAKQLNKIYNRYMYPKAHQNGVMDKLKKYAESIGENEFTVALLFWILCSQLLEKRYEKKGIDKQIFFDTMEDIKYKMYECTDCEEVCGVFTGDWHHKFFSMERFALGRFQYELAHLANDYVMPNGRKFKKNSRCLAIHIPSSGVSLTDEVRFDSYKKAFAFLKYYYKTDLMVMKCGSWLLYNRQPEFLPENSNVLKFLSDFDIISNEEHDGFPSGWRLFGGDSDLPFEQLPENFSLRKAYKNWLLKEGKTGGGEGIIVFDGERIVNKND